MTATVSNESPVKNPALRWYGGKFRLASWIKRHIPEHQCYVEPFGGAAGVLLRKKPSPVEVYNDLDGEVVNFFRVVRSQPKELFRLLQLTPFSREEFIASYDVAAEASDLERARKFFVRSWQGYGGPRLKRRTGWKIQREQWTDSRANQCLEWSSAVRNVKLVAQRFASVQVECDDALKVIQRFDAPGTLFYVDPPYPTNTRNRRWMNEGYNFELKREDHLHLANLLRSIQGMAIVSSYPNEDYAKYFPDWIRVETTSQTMNKTKAVEELWLSPNVVQKLGWNGEEVPHGR